MTSWKELLQNEISNINEDESQDKLKVLTTEFLEIINSNQKLTSNNELISQIESFIEQINVISDQSYTTSTDLLEKNYIPEISKELNLIVKHTEVSVNKILDIFDEICGLILKINNNPIKEELMSKSARILEVCNFQDNVGQRINIIVSNLSEIENTLFKILHEVAPTHELAKFKDNRPDSHLLNGPAIDAPTQKEIDDLFNSL